MHMFKVIFTDLDGTLLDENYRCNEAIEVIEKLKELKIPIVFVSAKTRFEQEIFRKMLGIEDPFIVEDGSAIYIPKEYFRFDLKMRVEKRDNYDVIVLGVYVDEIRKLIDKIREKFYLRCYSCMSVEEVAKLTGLSFEMAELAKRREFSETIVEADKFALKYLKDHFNVQIGGKFIHVYGKGADKGRAVRILTEIYRKNYSNVLTIGIGNSYTDIDMLRVVDIPALVKNRDGWIEVDFEVYKANGIATQGWIEVVKKFVLSNNMR